MPGGGLGRAGQPGKGPATPSSRSTAALLTKCLLEETSLLIPAPKGTKPSQQVPSTRSEHLSQSCFPPPCQFSVFSHLHHLYLVASIKRVAVPATSPLHSRAADQAQLCGDNGDRCEGSTHCRAVFLAPAGDLARPLSPGGFQKTTSLRCDRFFWC